MDNHNAVNDNIELQRQRVKKREGDKKMKGTMVWFRTCHGHCTWSNELLELYEIISFVYLYLVKGINVVKYTSPVPKYALTTGWKFLLPDPDP